MLDEAVAGVVEAKPQTGDLEVTAGLGPMTDRAAVHRSFRAAGRMLEAARAYGLRGAYGLGDLSWRVAVVAGPELGEGLLSVREYLKRGRHIREVARSADVHVDTVRYRLRPGGTRAGDASARSGSRRV
ncbi:hypothetical protein ACWET9_28885 [Streptomyces sp. NPDC004059]